MGPFPFFTEIGFQSIFLFTVIHPAPMVNEEVTSAKFKELKQRLDKEKDLEKIIEGLDLSVILLK